MAVTMSGEPIAARLLASLQKEAAGRKLTLVVVQVGENAVSARYIAEKQKAAERTGIAFQLKRFGQDILQEELERELRSLASERNEGIIVQLPLPSHLNMQEVLDAVPSAKDVDVLSSASFGAFALGRLPILPPTVCAIASLLKEHRVSLRGKNALVVGAGRLVGLPAALWLAREEATLHLANVHTGNLAELARRADIIVSGVGKPGLIQGDMVKEGAVVIDAGTSVEGGKTKGDVDFEGVSQKAGYVTPVPGGVGPLTVACLLQNLVILGRQT